LQFIYIYILKFYLFIYLSLFLCKIVVYLNYGPNLCTTGAQLLHNPNVSWSCAFKL
jgi:hypothetical protein